MRNKYGVNDEDGIVYQGASDDDDDSWSELIAKYIKENWNELKYNDASKISVDRVMKGVNKK